MPCGLTEPVSYDIKLFAAAWLFHHSYPMPWKKESLSTLKSLGPGSLRVWLDRNLPTMQPVRVLFHLILFFCVIGSYSVNNNTFDVFMMLLFGIIGYILRKFQYEPAPLIMSFVLGSMLENSLRQSLLRSMGSFSIFFTRPISCLCLVAALLLMLSSFVFRKKRRQLNERFGT